MDGPAFHGLRVWEGSFHFILLSAPFSTHFVAASRAALRPGSTLGPVCSNQLEKMFPQAHKEMDPEKLKVTLEAACVAVAEIDAVNIKEACEGAPLAFHSSALAHLYRRYSSASAVRIDRWRSATKVNALCVSHHRAVRVQGSARMMMLLLTSCASGPSLRSRASMRHTRSGM